MRVIGIDSSLTSSGLCVVRDPDLLPPIIECWCVESKPSLDRTPIGMSKRLSRILGDIEPEIAGADVVGLEGLSYASKGTAAQVLPWLWGRIVDLCVVHEVPLVVVPPASRMKYVTGKGNAAKDAVLAAAIRRWPNVDIQGNDTADALIVAAIVCRQRGFPIDDLPRTYWEPVMKKIAA